MKVMVQYLGFIREMLRIKEEEFELKEGALLSDLLNKIVQTHGERFRKEVFEPGQKDVKTGFVITVNGILSNQLRGVDTPLNTSDSVLLMTLPSGG